MALQMAASSGKRRPPFELRGLLLPVKQDERAAEEEEEEDDDDDAEAFDVASEDYGQVLLRPARKTVKIQEERSKKEYEVIGRFPFVGPWWKVNVKVKQFGSKYYMDGYPSYYLQTDAGKNQKAIISLFFKKCCVPEIFRDEFFEWLPKGSPLSFIHLEEISEQFKLSKLRKEQVSKDTKDFDIWYYIITSCAGKAVFAALHFPIVLEYLPKLLPCNVSDCIDWFNHSEIKCEDDRLTKLDKILKKDPWKLGFRIIMHRELGTYLAEASLKNLSDCGPLYQKIPLLQKNALILYEKLKERCRQMGHTYEEQDKLTDMVSKKMSVEHAWQSLKFLKDEEIVITEKKCVFLPKLYKAEKQIADAVYELRNKPPWHLLADVKKVLNGGSFIMNMSDSDDESELSDEEPCERDSKKPDNTSHVQDNCNNDFDSEEQTQSKESKCEAEVDPYQESAIELICSNPVTVISGKGGCGKTTIVSYLFRYLMKKEKEEVRNACKDFEADMDVSEEWHTFSHSSNVNINKSLNVLFTAPTGKAAALLFKKTKIPAYTLHQVMYSYKAWKTKGENSPWKFSSISVLVVDEGSLVPVGILASVLKFLLRDAQLTKLVILGDIRQLPSIEPGNMLADIFASFRSRGWSTELRTNHRSESQLIVDNATRISQQKYPVFDQVLKFSKSNKIWPMPSPEKKFILVVLPAEDGSGYLQSAIMALLEKGPGLEDPKQSQFITFRRKDCDIINEICCKHYSGHPMWDHKNRLQFLCGDKICSTRNEYITELLARKNIICTINDQNSEDSGPCTCNVCLRREERIFGHRSRSHDDDTRLCNGEIFFITEDKEVDDVRILTISITDGPEYTVKYQSLRKKSRIKHAWARTIHTFQGSEENTVVYVVGNAGRQNWQHVYTAVTRGRCRVYIVAEEANLKAAIARENFHRKTCLQKRLKEALTEKMSSSQPTSSQERLHNQDANTSAFTSAAETSSIHKEESVVSDKMEIDSGLKITDMVDAAEQTAGERKRQREFSRDCSSPSKVALITEENKISPLGTNLLQRMTLKSPTPKKLFSS
ncbi:DNA helicase B isoform X2 [Sceloporus undulatus]|uniref:DNA helicase B isoform X2 n=1 Tax=Sceloporus undulatus TaxID=8520 RepID=UPI001C4B4C4A|nr:DNA helicase B isoform X2 [Sceloporus undulatus]